MSRNHRIREGVVWSGEGLPLICHPLSLFFLNWGAMLVALSIHVTYVSYPGYGMPVMLFLLSSASMLCGYIIARLLLRRETRVISPARYVADATRMANLNLLFCIVALMVIVFNWVTEGPPPAFGDPTAYLTYGRFRQLLFPLLTVITVNAQFDPVRLRKFAFACFGLMWLAIYLTRGLLVMTLVEAFFVFSLTSTISKKKLYIISLAAIAFVVAGATVVGNIRTAHMVFVTFLQIRKKYADWPMASLWLTSYISIPLSNLCWMLKAIPYHGPTLAFLYPLLPSFLTPVDPHIGIHNDLRIIDGASTYLSAYVLDFSYLGSYIPNVLLGAASAWVVERGLPRQFLAAAIFLTCISFICFSDMFMPLSTIIQVIIQCVVQKRCIYVETENSKAGSFDRGV